MVYLVEWGRMGNGAEPLLDGILSPSLLYHNFSSLLGENQQRPLFSEINSREELARHSGNQQNEATRSVIAQTRTPRPGRLSPSQLAASLPRVALSAPIKATRPPRDE